MTAALVILFVVLVLSTLVWFGLCSKLFARLEHSFPDTYTQLGRPHLVLRNNLKITGRFLQWLLSGSFRALNAPGLARYCSFMRAYFYTHLLLFLALLCLLLAGGSGAGN